MVGWYARSGSAGCRVRSVGEDARGPQALAKSGAGVQYARDKSNPASTLVNDFQTEVYQKQCSVYAKGGLGTRCWGENMGSVWF
eukprot:8299994-Pyramimonas_sp.AAC.1